MIAKLQGPTTDFATTGLPQLTAAVVQPADRRRIPRAAWSTRSRPDPRGLIAKPPAKEMEVKP